jgi:hypothetical protein
MKNNFCRVWKIVRLILLVLTVNLVSCASDNTIEKKLQQVDQDPTHYVPAYEVVKISSKATMDLRDSFLEHYYSPWGDRQKIAAWSAETLSQARENFHWYLQHPGLDEGQRRIPQKVIQALFNNADLTEYPNVNKPAIVVQGAFVRALPTIEPSFGNMHVAGQGYPFDNLEESFIALGTPIFVLQKTHDGLWYLINTPSYAGWIPSQSVGFVSSHFILQWKQHAAVVALRDNIPLEMSKHRVLTQARMGVLYPMLAEMPAKYRILIPFLNANGDAEMHALSIAKTFTKPFPWDYSAKNIAIAAAGLMGMHYGWGGLYQLRDCSATMQDLFAVFGVWLPRSSAQQARMGQLISLRNATAAQKLKIIEEKAIPFFTLIHFPGHIALYIGSKKNRVYILQDVWGVHTTNLFGKTGRVVVGKTVITPLEFDRGYLNVKKTLLDRADSLSLLF